MSQKVEKKEFVGFRLTTFERRLAEAVAAMREQAADQPYSLSRLVRDSLMRTVREDLRTEIAGA